MCACPAGWRAFAWLRGLPVATSPDHSSWKYRLTHPMLCRPTAGLPACCSCPSPQAAPAAGAAGQWQLRSHAVLEAVHQNKGPLRVTGAHCRPQLPLPGEQQQQAVLAGYSAAAMLQCLDQAKDMHECECSKLVTQSSDNAVMPAQCQAAALSMSIMQPQQ